MTNKIPMSLIDWAVGIPARISEVCGEIEFQNRLCQLGFTKGEKINIESKIPFGGPVAVEIRGTVFSLRRDEADKIFVVEVDSD